MLLGANDFGFAQDLRSSRNVGNKYALDPSYGAAGSTDKSAGEVHVLRLYGEGTYNALRDRPDGLRFEKLYFT